MGLHLHVRARSSTDKIATWIFDWLEWKDPRKLIYLYTMHTYLIYYFPFIWWMRWVFIGGLYIWRRNKSDTNLISSSNGVRGIPAKRKCSLKFQTSRSNVRSFPFELDVIAKISLRTHEYICISYYMHMHVFKWNTVVSNERM